MINMRRVLLYAVTAFIAAVAVFYYWGIAAAAVTSIFAAAICMAAAKKHKAFSKFAWLIAAFYILGTVCFYLSCFLQYEKIYIEGVKTEVRGRIIQTDMRKKDADTTLVQIKMRVLEEDNKEEDKVYNENILVNRYIRGMSKRGLEKQKYDFVPGNVIKVSGIMKTPSERRNPGCFDYRLYLESIGIGSVINASDICVTEKSGRKTVRGCMYIIRENFLSRLKEASGHDTAAMMGGIMFGQKESMDEKVLEEFQKNGTAHILAVSGLHMGIIYGFLRRIWLWKKGWLFFTAATGFFICYGAMASFSSSVVRAMIMIELHMFGHMTYRRYDMASAAFFSALVMLIRNPMQLFNAGFQMSFIAVLTLALFIPIVKRFYKGIFLSPMVIQVGLMPYIAYTFNYISIGAVFINVPMVFLAGIIVPAGLCTVFFMGTCQWLFQIFSSFLAAMCHILSELNSNTAIEGVTFFSVASPDIRLVFLYYLILLVFVSEEGRLMIMRRQKKKVLTAVMAVIMTAALLGVANSNQCRNADVVFVDVGQGDCVHIKREKGEDYLIDCGGSINFNVGKEILRPYLLKNGVKKLDGIFVTHLHTDHYKGAAELFREGMADRLYIYEGYKEREAEILADTGLESEDIVYLYAGNRVAISQDTYIDVLWPDRKSAAEYKKIMKDRDDENDSCLVFKVSSRNFSVLITGDVDGDCQKTLEKKWGKNLKCDILKVAHHGSKYSYCHEFLSASNPQYAVFQVGKNNFGHPDQGVIENHMGKGIIVYRNDIDGAVAFGFEEKGRARVMTIRRNR